MVANMKVGTMDCFCVGEPWNEQLVNQDIGFTACTGSSGSSAPGARHARRLGRRQPEGDAGDPDGGDGGAAVVREAENKDELAAIVGKRQWFNVPVPDIIGRIKGDINYGRGRRRRPKLAMKFWGESGSASYPWKSLDTLVVTENVRWGKFEPGRHQGARRQNEPLRPVARGRKAIGVANPPSGDSRGPETFFDGKVFDPADPSAYLKSLSIKRAMVWRGACRHLDAPRRSSSPHRRGASASVAASSTPRCPRRRRQVRVKKAFPASSAWPDARERGGEIDAPLVMLAALLVV